MKDRMNEYNIECVPRLKCYSMAGEADSCKED